MLEPVAPECCWTLLSYTDNNIVCLDAEPEVDGCIYAMCVTKYTDGYSSSIT